MTSSSDRIWALTIILNKLRNQAAAPQVAPENEYLTTYQHIATLLTRGMEEKGDKKRKIAVTGSNIISDKTNVIIVEHLASEGPEQLVTTAQNPLNEPDHSGNDRDLVVEEIKLTDVQGPQDSSLGDHIRAIFNGLQNSRKGSAEKQKLRSLIWQASYRKILKRCHEDRKFFRKSILDILRDWKPEINDIQSAQYVNVDPSLCDHFNRHDIPYIQANGSKQQYLLSKTTLPAWIFLLDSLMQFLLDCASTWKNSTDRSTESALERPLYAYDILYRFLYRTGNALEVIFTHTSIADHLLDQSKLKLKHTEDVDAKLLESAIEHEAETRNPLQHLSTPQGIGRFALRLLQSIVAWPLAQSSLAKSPVIRKHLGVKLKLVHVSHPRNPSASLADHIDQLIQLVKLELTRRGCSQKRLQEVDDYVQNKMAGLGFSGAIHCEAYLMGLTVATRERHPDVLAEIRETFESCNGIIGVGKKCCYCCHWLGERLNSQTGSGITFRTSGSHGIVHPWIPPTIGVSSAVLLELENHLMKKVVDFFFYHREPVPESTHSSPAALRPRSELQGEIVDEIYLSRVYATQPEVMIFDDHRKEQ